MPDPQGWTKIEEPAGWTRVSEPAPAKKQTELQRQVAEVESALRPQTSPGSAAIAGSLLAVPTGGASIPLTMLASALGAAGGVGLDSAARQADTGKPEPAGDTLRSMAGHGVIQGLLTGGVASVPGATRIIGRTPGGVATALDAAGTVGVPGAKAAAKVLRWIPKLVPPQEAAAASENVGGRLVRPNGDNSIQSAITQALEEARTPPAPKAISTPPQPSLPAGYTPRSSAATARVPLRTAPAAAPKAAPSPAPKAALELPESWKPFVAKPTSTPLGIPEHAPIWSQPQAIGENPAKSLRHVFGAEDAGAMMNATADDVRAMSGEVAKHRPMIARLADLDRNYLRSIGDPKMMLALGAGGAAMFRDAIIKALTSTSDSSGR